MVRFCYISSKSQKANSRRNDDPDRLFLDADIRIQMFTQFLDLFRKITNMSRSQEVRKVFWRGIHGHVNAGSKEWRCF